jgi:tetratricopeptide (TPR) repeat protein
VTLPFLLAVLALGPQGTAGPDRLDRAAALVEQADKALAGGDYRLAEQRARDAAGLFGDAGVPALQAAALNKAGQAALYAGDYTAAAQGFEAALRISEAAHDAPGLAEQLGNLGNVHFFVGRYADAARSYDAAMAIVRSAGQAEWVERRRRIIDSNRAVLLQRVGRDLDALEVYRTLASNAGLRPAEHAQLLVNRGVLFRRLGDPIKALAAYAEARRLFATERHADGEIGAMKNRAIVLALDLERFDEAEQALTEILQTAEGSENRREMLHARLYRGETKLRAGRSSAARGDFDAALALARTLETPEEEWKALFGLARSTEAGGDRAAALDQSIAIIESIRETIRIPTLRADFFSDKAEVYDEAILGRRATAPTSDLFALIERAHSRAWRERLGLTATLTLESVRAALPPGTLLLDYWSSARGAVLIAVTRDRAATLPVALGLADVAALSSALSSATGDWKPVAARVSTAILPPADWLTGIGRIVVVAPGPLALVPFEVLEIEGRLLLERVAVTYAPTAAVLVGSGPTSGRWRAPWSRQLRAFGDPIVPAAADSTSAVAMLRSSGEEVMTVAAELGGRASLHLGRDNLKSYLSTPDVAPVLHIASHATASTTLLEQSRILFSPSDAAGEADYLSLREAYSLPLAGVALAVLSACETERGAVARGEGVQSFSRAFLAAGARSTVTTMWKVADGPTANVMAIFYDLIGRGYPKDEALRIAKRRFVDHGGAIAHPHYWAAFVLTGDGATPLPRVVRWSWIVGAAAAFAGVGVAGVVVRRRARRRAAQA